MVADLEIVYKMIVDGEPTCFHCLKERPDGAFSKTFNSKQIPEKHHFKEIIYLCDRCHKELQGKWNEHEYKQEEC
jgi:hypothetical protein